MKLNYRQNMTQQKQFFKAAAWLVGIILLTACTHDGELDNDDNQTHERLQFNLSFAQFNADKEAVNGSKAKVRAVSSPKTIDLGNGLELEVTAECDEPEPPTRVTPLYDGHYTILAIDNAGNRVGKIKGTVTSGNFTRDEDEKLDLLDGQQYTFICFNSAVTDDGTNLKFNDLDLHPAEQDMPLIGRVTWTVHSGHNFIPFEMKRQVGRVRFKLTTYTADAQNAKINLTTAHLHFRKAMYNPGTQTYAGEIGAGSGYAYIDENPVYGASGVAYDAMVKAHEQTTPYYYFLGNDVAAGVGFIIGDSYLQFTSGTAYGKALPTTKYHIGTIFNTHDNFTANSSYTFTIKVKSKDRLLLYQDGTVGYYGDRTTARMPIGIVTKEKTESEEGTAVALKNAGTGPVKAAETYFLLPFKDRQHANPYRDELSGYIYTYTYDNYDENFVWSEEYKKDYAYRLVHKNYPGVPFLTNYATAAAYSDQVPSTVPANIRWFLPSGLEWSQLFRMIASFPKEIIESDNLVSTRPWTGFSDLQNLFTPFGGNFPKGTYHMADCSSYTFQYTIEFDPDNNSITTYDGNYYLNTSIGYVRPFTHF